LSIFTASITAHAEDIDELGHVNNAVWVRWVQDVATAHWRAAGAPAHVPAYLWVITRHEIDYLKPLREGESVTARTWAEGPPKGARSTRLMEFIGDDDSRHVQSRTEWAMIDRVTGRPLRVTQGIIAPFLA
jgi:acyl-CoA thioester hydrolase